MNGVAPAADGDWQRYCTNELRRCIALGRNGAAEWGRRRWQLYEQAQRELGDGGRIIIADLNVRELDLRKYSFFSCYIVRCDFSGANLKQADFELAIVRDSQFNDARLTLCSFNEADLAGTNQFSNVVTLGQIDFAIRPIDLPPRMDGFLKDRARAAWAIRDDQRHEGSMVIRLTRRIIGYGLGLRRIALVSLGLVFAFGLLLLGSPVAAGEPFLIRLWACVLASVRYFVGLTDVFDDSNDLWAFVGLAETATGLLILALLVATLTRRLTISR
ncbi:pentapeptide repeat-containing protein [Brevundimonas sp.]